MGKNTWVTEGFEAFSRGTFENGGQNLYVSRKGVLQRVFQYDINGDGYPDILYACSQSMNERPPVHVYGDLLGGKAPVCLPSNGSYDGLLADLHGTGYQDLVLACQMNGTHHDAPSMIYFGGPEGFSENYRLELYAPDSTAVCAGDFNGDGKQELLFVSGGKLRMFYQLGDGFNPADFTDYDVKARYAVAADFDGDGITDVCVKDADGNVCVIFGGKGGLDAEHPVELKVCSCVPQQFH